MGSLLSVCLNVDKNERRISQLSVFNSGTIKCLQGIEFPVLDLTKWMSKVRNKIPKCQKKGKGLFPWSLYLAL